MRKGSKMTLTQRKRVSLGHKGQIPWSKGLTKETDDRLKRTAEKTRMYNKIGVVGMLGKKHTEETKEKQRKNNKTKLLWQRPKYREHMSEAHRGKMTGKKNPSYVDGRTPLVKKVRHCWKYRDWIKAVFKRDNWTCQDCGVRGKKLVAHHKKSFSKIWTENKIETFEQALNCKELWDIDNGKTLCDIPCHKKYNTRE